MRRVTFKVQVYCSKHMWNRMRSTVQPTAGSLVCGEEWGEREERRVSLTGYSRLGPTQQRKKARRRIVLEVSSNGEGRGKGRGDVISGGRGVVTLFQFC